MAAPESIRKLVETFEQNINEYRTNKNETELRLQFLNPFFEALGWDVNNIKGRVEIRKGLKQKKLLLPEWANL